MLFEPRAVGRRRLPTTVFGLLAHIGEHVMRHTGQVVTTARFVRAQSPDWSGRARVQRARSRGW